jgi:D-xylose transport system substrate-binding protein
MIAAGTIIIFAGIFYLSRHPSNPVINTDKDIVIGFSLGTLREDRWAKDENIFVKKAEDLGASVSVLFADNDTAKQLSQAENLILQGVNVLVVVPQDAMAVASIVKMAHKAGIKVIAYDRLIKNSDLDYYISFDNFKVGELEAQAVLDKVGHGKIAYIGGSANDNNSILLKEGSMHVLAPKIESGAISIVLDSFTTDWKPEEAYKTMKDYLKVNKTIDGVVAANDGTAFGVIEALEEYGLAGKVPVSGQDAEMGACQRIVAGTQTVTVYKPIQLLASEAAKAAVAIARGEKPRINTKINNGKIDVPACFLTPIAVTKKNILQTVIKDGYQSVDDVYHRIGDR